ncbi:hypothetical protein HK097_005362 [Rhizophlyctis rosea]|uniref:RanBP2-type domain-containing protein n=1 Tax=Rhizophlyctis rosea TaxID=64517 RepID=A0AAD5S0A8_9FUNG|nr:hypothetical protein HK097_005362 [Rhizophlyctis rosea]
MTAWACDNCTLVNEPDRTTCEVCDLPKPKTPPCAPPTPIYNLDSEDDEYQRVLEMSKKTAEEDYRRQMEASMRDEEEDDDDFKMDEEEDDVAEEYDSDHETDSQPSEDGNGQSDGEEQVDGEEEEEKEEEEDGGDELMGVEYEESVAVKVTPGRVSSKAMDAMYEAVAGAMGVEDLVEEEEEPEPKLTGMAALAAQIEKERKARLQSGR